jgi:stage V sporulation protein R
VQTLWRRPVNLVTRVEGRWTQFRYDGKEHSDRRVEL